MSPAQCAARQTALQYAELPSVRRCCRSCIREFAKRYPEIQLDAHTPESLVDVVGGGYDVVIRVAQRLTDST